MRLFPGRFRPGLHGILCALALSITTLQAQAHLIFLKAIIVRNVDVAAVDVTVSVGKKNYTIYCYGKVPGKVKPSGSGLSFTSYADLVKRYKQDPVKFAAKLKVAKALKKAGNAACAGNPEPDRPQATPTRASTPTRTTSGGCDSSGNTTSFSIPSGLTGNKSRGQNEWNSACSSCHASPKRGKSYSTIQSALNSEPQMLPLNETNQEVADVAAYLNCP